MFFVLRRARFARGSHAAPFPLAAVAMLAMCLCFEGLTPSTASADVCSFEVRLAGPFGRVDQSFLEMEAEIQGAAAREGFTLKCEALQRGVALTFVDQCDTQASHCSESGVRAYSLILTGALKAEKEVPLLTCSLPATPEGSLSVLLGPSHSEGQGELSRRRMSEKSLELVVINGDCGAEKGARDE
jgi:hypothetical protein